MLQQTASASESQTGQVKFCSPDSDNVTVVIKGVIGAMFSGQRPLGTRHSWEASTQQGAWEQQKHTGSATARRVGSH